MMGLAALLATMTAGSTSAQDIRVRLSIKLIHDFDGSAPTGVYGDPGNILSAVDQTNESFRRYGRGYGYEVVEILSIHGQGQFYEVANDTEYQILSANAQSDPAFLWNSSATNIYIVDTAHAAKGGTVVMLMSNLIDINWIHELGHHNGLAHTFALDDGVADTVPEPNVNQCTSPLGCDLGGSDECCCTTKEANLQIAAAFNGWTQEQYDDIRFNAMSYFGARDCVPLVTFDNIRLTPGQLDLWTDTSRISNAHEASGLTYFVDANATAPFNGLSTDPFPTLASGLLAADPTGGDIVLLRPGTYSETGVIDQEVVLRARDGSAVIGL